MQPDLQDQASPGRREFALAKAYTEARARLSERLLRTKVWALLLLVLTPLCYGALMPVVTDDLNADWFRAWAEATAGLGRLLMDLLPGLATAARSIYGGDPQGMAVFLHFASVDLICILGTSLVLLGLTPLPSVTPRARGLQFVLLRDLTRGMPISRFGDRRVGGAAGGVLAALAGVALVFGALHFLYFDPMLSGEFFTDAHAGCNASGINRLAVEQAAADPCLGSVVWNLGWRSSIAAAAIPIGIWFCLASLLYPFWLILGRPTR